MRISPPISGTLWREIPVGDEGSDEPLVVDGHLVPAGIWVGVNMYALHHNEEYFPEPFAFKPERWLPEAMEKGTDADNRTLRQAFSPFGVGSRSCVGKAMAYMEASLVLARVIWYFNFERPQSARLDSIGGGMSGGSTGRKRVDEFQIYDQFIADHDGPCLMFKVRGELWQELC